MSMENNIKLWLSLENKIKQLNEEISNLRDKKNTCKNNIYNEINEKNLKNPTIKIGNSYLKFVETKQNTPISYKFLITALKDCCISNSDIDNIISYIKENREIKLINDIKRFNK